MDSKAAEENLMELKQVFDSHGVKFWLTGGVLLGAVREEDFIPWDEDMDLIMLAEDYDSSLCDQFRAKSFIASETRIYLNKVSAIALTKRNIRTDLILQYYYPPDGVYVYLAKYPSDHGIITPAKFYKKDCFIEFLGEKFRVPNPPEEWLDWVFDKKWKTPVKTDWTRDYKRISLDKYLKWFEEND